MKRAAICLLLLSVVAFSCKPNKRKLLLGKWGAIKLENPGLDSFYADSQHYIDTLGKNNDSATNMNVYGSTNMDSMRQLLQQQYDSARNAQREAVVNTEFTFRNDSIVILAFNGSTDSSRWLLDEKNNLVLSELNNHGGAADNLKMEILSVDDSVLKLKFVENNSFSTVTFHHQGK